MKLKNFFFLAFQHLLIRNIKVNYEYLIIKGLNVQKNLKKQVKLFCLNYKGITNFY